MQILCAARVYSESILLVDLLPNNFSFGMSIDIYYNDDFE